jgi:2-oxoglutarate ferredoxin oxidoreductase subunit alpha
VCLDSDEHDEEGRITEDMNVRTRMVDKRLKKLQSFAKESIPPTLHGEEGCENLVIGWGSTHGALKEAVKNLDDRRLALLHFRQVHPLHPRAAGYIEGAGRTIMVENNATSQFGKILATETGHRVDHTILKYDGLPFSVEELEKRIKKLLG